MKRFLLILLLVVSLLAMSNPTSVDAFRGDLKDTTYNASRWTEKRTGASRKSIKDKFVLVDAAAGTAAPKDAKYIVQQLNGTLTDEQALGELTTGALWSITSTGVVSIAPTLTSLEGLTISNGVLLYGTGADALAVLSPGAQGTLLMGNGAAAPSFLAAGASGYFLLGAGAADPVWTSQPTLASLEGLVFTAGDIIYASGADTLVVLDAGTAGYVLKANGAAAPIWTAPPYKTIELPIARMQSSATNGAVFGTSEKTTNDVNDTYYQFIKGTETCVEISVFIPEEWDLGTLKVKFPWSSATGSTAGDTVEWQIACRSYSDGDALDQAMGTQQVISDTLLADNGTDGQMTPATPALTCAGTPALGDRTRFKICRNISGGDNMAEASWLHDAPIVQFQEAATAVAAW